MKKQIIICSNCFKKQSKKYIQAMGKAGFGLRHLECKACGKQALTILEEKETE